VLVVTVFVAVLLLSSFPDMIMIGRNRTSRFILTMLIAVTRLSIHVCFPMKSLAAFVRPHNIEKIGRSRSRRHQGTIYNNFAEVSDSTIASSAINNESEFRNLESRLIKNLLTTCKSYDMLESGDHIMVCVSGGKDSASLLVLLQKLQQRFARTTPFHLTAVHLNQMQPGYDNTNLLAWLDSLNVTYRIVTEDTYSIVTEKVPSNKTYCSLCSRLRRGILSTVAHEIGANKIALGHHGDDAIETLFLNMIHSGQIKGMPARYYSESRGLHVLRPLITCIEADLRRYAEMNQFPILPCNLCGSQPEAQRKQMKMYVELFKSLSPDAATNLISSMSNIRPTHLLDRELRRATGLDSITGRIVEPERAAIIGEIDTVTSEDWEHQVF
jgi:tRNA 2-thiocytidine biosynthesis protein TtcA